MAANAAVTPIRPIADAKTSGEVERQSPAWTQYPGLDVSRRHVMRRAETVGLLMRNSVNLVVGLVALADPNSLSRPAGKWLLAAIVLWSCYRVLTRSHWVGPLIVDYLLVVAASAAIPVLIADPQFYSFNTAPQAIAGTAVVSISVALSPTVSLPMTLGVAAAYAWGALMVVGWENLSDVGALYYFALQWFTASMIRMMLLRVASTVDRVRTDRHAAELNKKVMDAVRDYEREQLALLHDTAASTLLMVGQGTSIPRQRLAVQANRDLELLRESPWVAPPARVEIVGALHQCAELVSTPVRFDGASEVWLEGETATAVIAAAREAMTNVDRHARARELRITVSVDSVLLADDGVGFDPAQPRSRHGVNDSIIGRMQRAGGRARISSSPGSGTQTELHWAVERPGGADLSDTTDPDRLIERIRARYGLALVVYALANLAFAVPQAVMTAGDRITQAVLGGVAALSVLAAVPGILRSRWGAAWPGLAAMVVVTAAQPALLPPELVGGYAHWAQSAAGWCVVPLVLGLPTRIGAALVVLYWTIGAIVEIACNPTSAVLVNVGFGSASILGVQLFALIFNGLMRDATADAQAETRAHQLLITRDRVALALLNEYQRRYAKLVANVVPLLQSLSESAVVDDSVQRRARAECRRLRALFDQATMFDHPLMQRVRPLVDSAEARNVDIVVDLAGDLPTLTEVEIDSLVEPLARVLDLASASARLVITSTTDDVSLSIVCDAVSADLTEMNGNGASEVECVVTDDMVWCLIRHRRLSVVGTTVN